MSQHGLNGNPGRRSSPGRRYRRLLISLAAAAVVPMVVYGSVQGWLRANAERRALDATNLEEAQRLALLVDNELMAELNGLRMLSLSHELDTDNLGGFYDLARRAHFENELWRSVIVIDPNTNEILLNTLFPIGSPYQPVQDPETVREVFEQHNAVIGAPTGPGLVPGTNRMHPAFVPLRVPVLRGDEMHYVLSASMSPDQLRALLWNVSPPGLGGDSYLLDPYGHIVARNRSPGQFAELAPEALRTEIPKQEGTYRGSVDGQEEVFAFATAPFCHWSVHLGIPIREYNAPYRRSFLISTSGIVFGGALALGLIAMIWREIRRQRREENTLQHALRIEAIGRLTAGVAHDFNNLLCTVIGNLDLIKMRVAGNEVLSQNIEAAIRAASHCAELIQQLLSFGRKQTLNPEPVEMNSAVRSAEGLIHQSIGENIHINLQLCDGGCPALVDPKELSLSVLNLITNARDAMPEGGTLTLRTRCVDLRRTEHVDGLRPGRYAVLTVIDTGIGMTEKVMTRAFEPFFTTKEIGKGTGLGLSQVYGVVRQSGGTVRLHSKEGQGSQVEMWLPATR